MHETDTDDVEPTESDLLAMVAVVEEDVEDRQAICYPEFAWKDLGLGSNRRSRLMVDND